MLLSKQKGDPMETQKETFTNFEGVRAPSYQDIVKVHNIHDVRVSGKVVIVNDGFKNMSYHYSNEKIAQGVARKLKMFKGVV